MASSLPSSSSAPASPPSVSNSDNSATQPSLPKRLADAESCNGVHIKDEQKPNQTDQYDDLNGEESVEKFNKFEADYARRLMAKYFSKKNLYGGDMFDEDTTIDNEIIKSSRWPCTRSFADPVRGFQYQNGSCSIAESPNDNTNGKLPLKKTWL